jgi:hypothetical protein
MGLIVSILFTLLPGLVSSSSAQNLDPAQQSALTALKSAMLVGFDQKSVKIQSIPRTIVFFEETHVMDPGSNSRIDAVLNTFKIRALEGYHCEGYVCEGFGYVYMKLLDLASYFHSGSSILEARSQGWYFTSTGELGYQNYLVGHGHGRDFELSKGLVESMNHTEGEALKRFVEGVRKSHERLDPEFDDKMAFDDSPYDFKTPPAFNAATPVNLEIEYGALDKFRNCPTQSWLLGARNCRMAANITTLLSELPEIQVLLVQTGSGHTEDLKNLIVDTP